MIKILKIYAIPQQKNKSSFYYLHSFGWDIAKKLKKKNNTNSVNYCIAGRSKRQIIIYNYKILKVNKETPEKSENIYTIKHINLFSGKEL